MKTKSFLMLCAFVCMSFMAISCSKEEPDVYPFNFDIQNEYTVNVGETFCMELQSQPGVGEWWEWTNKEKVSCVDLVNVDEYCERKGGVQIEKWYFSGIKAGTETLLLDYKNVHGEIVYNLKVNVSVND